MGLRDDIKRYKEVGDEKRPDLEDFIKEGDMSPSDEDTVRLPFKIIQLPGFEYEESSKGGIGQAQDGQEVEEGDVVEVPEESSDEDGEEGDEEGEDGDPGEDGDKQDEYYDLDPEEFAEELDEELGLNLEPKKSNKVKEEKEGAFVERVQTGPSSTLDLDYLFKQGLKREMAVQFDENFALECLKTKNVGPQKAFEYLRDNNVVVSKAWLDDAYDDIPSNERTKWDSLEEFEENVEREEVQQLIRENGVQDITFRPEDERYKYPETIEEKQSQVVVINIRDVSGSMREEKRDLVQRVMAPMDWYLQGKYDQAVFFYVAHNNQAWTVEQADFFRVKSGGGTRISSAYDLSKEILTEFPFENWNRYVFAAGDGENSQNDTEDNVIPMLKSIDANMHAYIETNPKQNNRQAIHADELEDEFGEDSDEVVVTRVNSEDDVIPAIKKILGNNQ